MVTTVVIPDVCVHSQVDVMALDLSSFDSVRSFAAKFQETKLPLNILV